MSIGAGFLPELGIDFSVLNAIQNTANNAADEGA